MRAGIRNTSKFNYLYVEYFNKKVLQIQELL